MSKLPEDEKRLLERLASGECCSGEDLGATAGITRAAIWKHVAALRSRGVPIDAVPGRGYQLKGGLQLLEERSLWAMLSADARTQISSLHILDTVTSTSDYVSGLFSSGQGHGAVCLAEQQTSGRGRRGRTWVSPFGKNLYFSYGWQFKGSVSELSGLSLAVGVMVARAINKAVGIDVRLKWPNDLQVNGAKLGGILIELSGDAAGPFNVVIGVGVNIDLSDEVVTSIDQSVTSLAGHVGSYERSEIIAAIVSRVVEGVSSYSGSGFSGFREAWDELDALRGMSVSVSGAHECNGIVHGIGAAGQLILRIGDELHEVSSGEVSVRGRDAVAD